MGVPWNGGIKMERNRKKRGECVVVGRRGGRRATCGDSASKKLYSSRVRCLFLFCPSIHIYFVHPLDARFIQHLFCFVFFVFRAPSSLSLDSIQTAFPLIFHRFFPTLLLLSSSISIIVLLMAFTPRLEPHSLFPTTRTPALRFRFLDCNAAPRRL